MHRATILAVVACDKVPLVHVAGVGRNLLRDAIADEEDDLQLCAVGELQVKGRRVALLLYWKLLGVNLHT